MPGGRGVRLHHQARGPRPTPVFVASLAIPLIGFPAADSRALGESVEDLEIRLLLEGVYCRSGLDFRAYAAPWLRRRIRRRAEVEGVTTISRLQEKVLHDGACMDRLTASLTIHPTSMFRDPGLFATFRQKVVPLLRTYPSVRLWHAGCATGEEVYSMAIVLDEEGLYDRCRIYATDLCEAPLRSAEGGLFPLAAMREYTDNYLMAGGKRAFSEYYVADHRNAVFRASLRQNVVFARHDLASDASFNEFNVIFCRNVLIYFNRELQNHVHRLLFDSLGRLGILALGRKESLRFTPQAASYATLDEAERMYRKVRA